MVFIHIYSFEWYFCELDYPLRPLQFSRHDNGGFGSKLPNSDRIF